MNGLVQLLIPRVRVPWASGARNTQGYLAPNSPNGEMKLNSRTQPLSIPAGLTDYGQTRHQNDPFRRIMCIQALGQTTVTSVVSLGEEPTFPLVRRQPNETESPQSSILPHPGRQESSHSTVFSHATYPQSSLAASRGCLWLSVMAPYHPPPQ